MTVEKIRERRAQIQTQFERKKSQLATLGAQVEQAKLDLSAIDGALQDCDFWLAQAQAEAKENAEAEAKPTAPVALVKD